MVSPVCRRGAPRRCAGDVSQHLGVHANALAQVLERDALVVAVDPLELGLLHHERAEAVSV